MVAGSDNLKPFGSDKLTEAEQRELQRKGGIASGKARSARARERDEWKKLLEMAMHSGDAEDITSLADAKKANLTIGMAMKVKLITEVLKGNLRAYELIQRYAGVEVTDTQEETQTANYGFVDALNKAAAEVWKDEEVSKKE